QGRYPGHRRHALRVLRRPFEPDDRSRFCRSVNMPLLITNDKNEIDHLAQTVVARLGAHAADARDTCLAGTPDEIREQLRQLKAAGATTLFIPTFLRPLAELGRDMD